MPLPDGTRLVGVGLFASGTTSLARLFSGYGSAFEYQPDRSLAAILADRRGAPAEALETFVERRLAQGLALDSAGYNWYYADRVARLDPSSRFVLLIRHPLDWLDSMLNKFARRTILGNDWRTAYYAEFIESRLDVASLIDPRLAIPRLSEAALEHWVRVNRSMLEALPPERRFVVATDQLSRRTAELARFAGVEPGSLRLAAVRSNVNWAKAALVPDVDRSRYWDRLLAEAPELLGGEWADAWGPGGLPRPGPDTAAAGD